MLFRWLFGVPGAALVTAALFLAMAFMIRQEATLGKSQTPEISILAKLDPTPPGKRPPTRRPPIAAPDPVRIDFPERGVGPDGVISEIPTGPDRTIGPIIIPGAMHPVVRIPPPYPDNCRSRGAQGVVIVEFDVTAEGDVVNPRILSSADGCLDRTVLSTIQKWKYPPPEQDGRPVARRGVREVFNFQLEG